MLLPLSILEVLSETFHDKESISGHSLQALHALLNRDLFETYGLQLAVLKLPVSHEVNKLSSNRLVVLSLFDIAGFLYFKYLLLVISDDAPLDGLLFAFEFADHFLGCLHLLAALIQLGVQGLVLLIDT